MQNDDELERYLGEFLPRAVRPLEVRRPTLPVWLQPMAAAAVVLVCAGSAVWFSQKTTSSSTVLPVQMDQPDLTEGQQKPNLFTLTRLALEDDREFQNELEKESRAELPSFESRESGLRILARE